VHVRLGELEARLRLFESAEARFLEALRLARQSFEAQAAYGRFLMARGRHHEALAHLELAHQFEPPAEFREQRLALRLDLAAARFAEGKLLGADGAAAMYESALTVEPRDSRALAGKLALAVVEGKAVDTNALPSGDSIGFQMLLSQGLAQVRAKQWERSRDLLMEAADADPLRAFGAWRALSWLAELTGYPSDALRFCELALEAAPDDAWTLFQRGRLLIQRDDPEGAARDFKAALDLELAFTDAIAGLGEIAASRGEAADAEMYFGRALELDPARAELEARRGYNYLTLNDTARAEASFKRAAAINPDEPGARAGKAWCAYRRNDPAEAAKLFRELDDARRAFPETDPWRMFATTQIKRIGDHVAKEVWEDDFDRQRLANGWSVEEAAGPLFSLSDGALRMHGDIAQTDGTARVWQEYASHLFISLEMDVTVSSKTTARVGMFVSREKERQGVAQITSQISVERHREGGLQVRLMDKTSATIDREDITPVGGVPWWPTDKAVRLRIERLGDGSDSLGRISVDGIPVADGFSMRTIASTGNVRFGLFANGDQGHFVDLKVDNVQVVRRTGK
jgi:tetratricopeptide (TPR) repeat protein